MILREPLFKVVRSTDKRYVNGAFEVIEPLSVLWQAKRCVLTVEPGTITNFASIPTGFRNIFPVNGRHRLAAVAHDALYGARGVIYVDTVLSIRGKPMATSEPVKVYYSRLDADELFHQIMIHEGVSKGKACAMFKAVKWFGGKAWDGK